MPASPSPTQTAKDESTEPLIVDLKDPRLAALLAWLIPGAGHLYQGRTAKGILFLTCILGTFFYGMYLGDGKVVYATQHSGNGGRGIRDVLGRWPYLCQVGVGLPALPAVVQAYIVRKNPPGKPLLGGWMAPPMTPGQIIPEELAYPGAFERLRGAEGYVINFHDELRQWQLHLHAYFDLGTAYTMIAGLLNLLAIYDAWGGPLLILPKEDEKKNKKNNAGASDKQGSSSPSRSAASDEENPA